MDERYIHRLHIPCNWFVSLAPVSAVLILMEVTVKRVPLRISLTSAEEEEEEAVTFDGTKSMSESKITSRTLAISIIKPFVLHLIVQAESLVKSSLALEVSPVEG